MSGLLNDMCLGKMDNQIYLDCSSLNKHVSEKVDGHRYSNSKSFFATTSLHYSVLSSTISRVLY